MHDSKFTKMNWLLLAFACAVLLFPKQAYAQVLGRELYGWQNLPSGTAQFVGIDPTTGVITPFGPTIDSQAFNDSAFGNKRYYYELLGAPDQLYAIDTTTSPLSASAIGSGTNNQKLFGLQFDNASGQLYGWQNLPSGAAQFVGINPTTGVITPLGPTIDSQAFNDSAFGNKRYYYELLGAPDQLYAIDTTTSPVSASAIGGGTSNQKLFGLQFDNASGQLYGWQSLPSGAAQFVGIDPTTGVITPFGPTIDSQAFNDSAFGNERYYYELLGAPDQLYAIDTTISPVSASAIGSGTSSALYGLQYDCCEVEPNQKFLQSSTAVTLPSYGYCPPGQSCPTAANPPSSWPGGNTIALCATKISGCALTSTATMLTSFPFLNSITPTSLNDSLAGMQPPGYKMGKIYKALPLIQKDQCEMDWCRIPEVINTAAQAAGRPDIIQMVDSGNQILNWTDPACDSNLKPWECYLLTHLCKHGDRVILKLNEFVNGAPIPRGPHFIYVEGESQNGATDWDVFDPGWTNASSSLSGHLSGFVNSVGKPVRFTIAEAETYRNDTKNSRSALSAKANSPVELLLTDPSGNRLGNLQPGTDVFEIPLGSYLRDFPLADDTADETANGDPSGIKTVYDPAGMRGVYTLTATGTDTGSFSLEFRGVATDGSIQDDVVTGTTAPGSTSTYEIVYDPTPGSNLLATLVSSKTGTTAVVASSLNPSAAGQSVAFTAIVSPVSGSNIPTGNVAFYDGANQIGSGTLNSQAQATFGTSSLVQGTHSITLRYGGDTNFNASVSPAFTQTVTAAPATPTVTVTPSASSITTVQPLTVTVAVNGGSGNPVPTGSVMLTSDTYTSAGTSLSGGSATINIPAGSLTIGSDSLIATYIPDSSSSSTYNSATGSNSVTVTAAPKTTPTVTVTPSDSSITTAQPLTVTVAVNGGSGNPAPTGSVMLASGTYTSAATSLSSGGATVSVPAGSLAVGTDTLTASYSGDASYTTTIGTGSVTVTTAVNPTFTVTGTTVTLAPGAATGNTSTITVTPAGGFTGSVAMTASVTSSPTGAQHLPTLSFGSTALVSITATAAATATLTITTTAPTSATLVHPKLPGAPWYASTSAALACILLFGIPARRRRWQTMLGMLALFVALSSGLVACDGRTRNSGTTSGTYTITVTGASSSTTTTGVVTLRVQ